MTAKEFNYCLRRIGRGDNGGMEKIYKEYYPKLVFTITKEMHHASVSEDLASDIILSILKNAKNYRYVQNPNAWAYSAARYAAINYKRKEHVEFVDLQDLEEIAAADNRLDFKIEFDNAYHTLTEKQQSIVELYYVYGYKHREVSAELGMSTSTVKREIAAIKNILKNLLKK